MTKIQLRRDSAANWAAQNPVLDYGEPGIDLTSGRVKIGDGVTAWNSLAYEGDLPLTTRRLTFTNGGQGGTVTTSLTSVTAGSFRVPVRLPVTTRRWRLKLRNYLQPSTAQTTLNGTQVKFGKAARLANGNADETGNWDGAPQTLVNSAFTIPANGTFYYSPWFENADQQFQAGQVHLLALGFTSASNTLRTSQGKSFWWANATSGLDPAITSGSSSAYIPMDFQIEYEVTTDRPAYLFIGDSIMEGVTGAIGTSSSNIVPTPLHHSYPYMWAERHGGLAVNIALAGIMASQYGDLIGYQQLWTRVDHSLANYDGVVIGLGSNDASSSRTLAQFQTDIANVVAGVRQYVSQTVPLYFVDVLPRASASNYGGYNDWYVTNYPHNAAGVVEMNGPMRASGTAMESWYTCDNIHLSYYGLERAADILSGVLPSRAARQGNPSKPYGVRLTQAQYDALGAGRDPNQLYLIKG